MKIAFLHTADVHVVTFDTLLNQLGFDGTVRHVVRPDLLARARTDGVETVAGEARAVMTDLSQADAVMCTCSTLGPIADEVAQQIHHLFRIDEPMIQAACAHGPDILVVMCLPSTQAPTLALLERCAARREVTISPRLLKCPEAWCHFEAGDGDAFAQVLARSIRAHITQTSPPDCVVLAQASMSVAASRLNDLDMPVFSSPLLAARRVIKIAAGSVCRSMPEG